MLTCRVNGLQVFPFHLTNTRWPFVAFAVVGGVIQLNTENRKEDYRVISRIWCVCKGEVGPWHHEAVEGGVSLKSSTRPQGLVLVFTHSLALIVEKDQTLLALCGCRTPLPPPPLTAGLLGGRDNAEEVRGEGGPAHEEAIDVRLGNEAVGTGALDRASIDDAEVLGHPST